MEQSKRIDHRLMKGEISFEFMKRVRDILKTKIDSKYLFKSIKTYACSVLVYSFRIVKWNRTDVDNLQLKIRTLHTKFNNLHPKSSVERTTLPKHEGGRRLAGVDNLLDQQIEYSRDYFHRKSVDSHLHRVICQIDYSIPPKLSEGHVTSYRQNNNNKLPSCKEKPKILPGLIMGPKTLRGLLKECRQ
ncbi:hypothetical protein WA026_014805 [Henosepilachna vigintioctopunctata]|uniref:Uncharacterized protein n=1 Tax=Henosepilachna vigintioctopunctata TaxID=420089 RepID=A0AAW1V2C1_9CUCU